ncbi:proline and serine-rich protein 2 isoform X2 [Erinaceus europaeus]|uniref:Proline and serine-rich protein 2 isoform X2 n=1 Tax=Erinaceus europaeus TaxID=9365 RepID=A0A1S3WDB2_ERIEU|nr:proline and serine-rich protein 2 isoform X2 [Erinaceus europaeus]
MPLHHQKTDSVEMDPDLSLSCRQGDLSRGGSLESRSSSSRSRSFTLDDESLKYLTHEEKDVILFFEETIDALEDDLEEQDLCDSGVLCHSPPSLEESTSSHSESEDVIDLVPPGPAAGQAGGPLQETRAAGPEHVGKEDIPVLGLGRQDAEPSPPLDSPDLLVPKVPGRPQRELLSPSPPAEHPKLPRSVPTPLVIAQKISEKLAGEEALSLSAPWQEGRPGERRTPSSPAPRGVDAGPKLHRFPSNISLTNSAGRDFNQTISRAAVSVQERKARVLANIHGASFLAGGDLDERVPRSQAAPSGPTREVPSSQQSRAVQTDHTPSWHNGFQSIHDVLRSQPGAFVATGKTVTIRPDPAITGRLARQNASKSFYEPRPVDCGQDARKRSGSLPRAVGFRPQGITVQFSGRGSTEEARREALRKLGLLKENL